MKGAVERSWEQPYEELRAAALAGEAPPDAAAAARLARFGVAGLAGQWRGWQILAKQAAEPRWTGSDPHQATLQKAYQLIFGGRR
jgi:hypothetical protein